ncbi:MATE family efflux transporter [Sphingopyxis sp. H115]|uniref:MATE family efflux transporter n=1 Tax=Sphingopyxis sp. H115 TaxID=1759073 RepID=UPI0007366862|nr:MATE family efflux transporter [Sphingopyxis sp. H115]KTE14074.1 MATE family efflux transporter [Sphingopyxis sp. H115]
MLHQPTPVTAHRAQGFRAEFRATLALAWPLVLTNLTMSLIGATDVLMVGWLGPTQLAAASLGFNLAMLLGIFGMGLVMGASPLMASEIGRRANSVRDIRRTFRQTLWLVAVVAVPMLFILWNTGAILNLLGQDRVLAALAQDYVRAYMWSIPLFLATLAFRNFLAALERPMWSLVVGVVGVAGNILFNYTLIFGKFGFPALGLVGAGVGSVLTNMVMLLLMVGVVYRDRRFRRYHLLGRWWRSDWPRFFQMTRIGTPIAVSHAFEAGVFSAAVMLMGWISTAAVAAHAVALQLASLTFMVPMGLAQAATVRVGIGYGRADPDHIRLAGWTSFAMGTGFMAVMALIMLAIPGTLAGFFIDRTNPANAEVAELAVSFLIIAALFQIADGAQVVGQGMLRGLHDTFVPMLFALFGYWVIGIGVGAWLAFERDWGGVGIWTGLATGLAIVAVLMLARWMQRERLGLLGAATPLRAAATQPI